MSHLGIDGLVILGGDDLSEYYKGWMIWTDLAILKKISKKINIYLIGQTIGPFNSWRKKYAKYCFKNCQIILRDTLSADLSK